MSGGFDVADLCEVDASKWFKMKHAVDAGPVTSLIATLPRTQG